MLKEKVQELQIEISRLSQKEKFNQSVQIIENLREKMTQTDKHLRMTLDRLTEEHMKCQKLEQLCMIKEKQVVSTLEVADRVSKHLLKIQQEDKLFKLDKFQNEEFEANLSVLRHIRMERLQEENELAQNGDAESFMPQNAKLRQLNAIDEDASLSSTYNPGNNRNDRNLPNLKQRKQSKPRNRSRMDHSKANATQQNMNSYTDSVANYEDN